MDIDTIYLEIGQAIRDARKRRGWTQERLADATGYLRTSIANLEAGRQRTPLDSLLLIAEALDVPVGSLLPPLFFPDTLTADAFRRIAVLETRLARIAALAEPD
jgi:transcriptional regulator with XRE-family HTH domain